MVGKFPANKTLGVIERAMDLDESEDAFSACPFAKFMDVYGLIHCRDCWNMKKDRFSSSRFVFWRV